MSGRAPARPARGEPTAADVRWMRRCLQLAARAEGRTAPNPVVGCVVVDGRGRKLAEGWHRRAGTAHAEIVALDALAAAGRRGDGATLYVNLEPCNHHGRTGPCAPAVAAAGIRRVVIGAMDPVAGHAGGARWLARHGVEVVTGVLGDASEALNRPFFTWARLRRPHVVLKAGVSLDGRVATRTGASRWITGEAARAEVHRLRDRLDAVLVGIGTVLADDPRLTVRGVAGGRDPVRVVVDSRLRTPVGAALLAGAGQGARVIIATTAAAPASRQRRLEAAGAEVWRLRDRGGRVDLRALVRRLGAAGVLSVLVEAAPRSTPAWWPPTWPTRSSCSWPR
ncbi:MAG: bifunctional diaminohydroxyphosphoribosylaminopyrimidine deaminase/5-amino-6-(5-phosphoribosylamino)uracil reductase RibD [Kofleriaceae bacterium]|nr:bifunctional diaminohydroxyphosphoribosylaminopyrimidine deaminase/5-amino-6-(5-phosphoribosylamino)uracil reductase RibD [Kofleriaceae bacterium]MCB9572552.1 bifunctional diaminohydroxyphosphoribosylaminopyrimidine deaminase/5-amino-6-(5-phosphoribosylamino)uracil reductase RibD [Kofleriaceae bacterium]